MELTPRKRRILEAASGRLRIEFGTNGTPTEYEAQISASDRATFEAAINDTRSDDYSRSQAARAALRDAFDLYVPGMLGWALGGITTIVMGFAGRAFNAQLVKRMGGGASAVGYNDDSTLGVGWSVGTYMTTEGFLSLRYTRSVANWHKREFPEGYLWEVDSDPIFQYRSEAGNILYESNGGTVGIGSSTQGNLPTPDPPPYNVIYDVGQDVVREAELWVCDVGPQFPGLRSCRKVREATDSKEFGPDDFDLGEMSDSPFGATEDLSVDAPTTQDIITGPGGLTGSDWHTNYPPDTTQPPSDPEDPTNFPAPDPEGGPTGNPPIVGGSDGPGGGHVTLPPDYDPDDPNYEPGKEICFLHDGIKKCHKIRHRDGPRVEYDSPPYGDQTFSKPWCKKRGTKINAMIRELALQLGMSPNLVVVAGCEKRWPGGCMRGNKLDALWELQDMCGYGIFNPPGGDEESGPITPINVFHDYHENDTLIEMEPVVDDSELYRKVVVWKRRRNGSVLEVPVTVAGTTLLPDDRIYYRAVPRNTSEADMLDLAHNLADRFALKTKMVRFLVPYKLSLAPRHQVTLRVPSMGFTGVYMVWPDSVVHSTENVESLWATEARGAELSVERYAPRFEYVP